MHVFILSQKLYFSFEERTELRQKLIARDPAFFQDAMQWHHYERFFSTALLEWVQNFIFWIRARYGFLIPYVAMLFFEIFSFIL